jgi:hypothetical protein
MLMCIILIGIVSYIFLYRELFGSPLNPLEFELDDGPCIEKLLSSYPTSICVEHLPHPSEELEDKIGVVEALYKEGLLVVEDEISRGANSNSNSENGSDEESDDDPF